MCNLAFAILHIWLNMQFGMYHFAYLVKYAIWHFAYLAKYGIWHQKNLAFDIKKSLKTFMFITLHLAPHKFIHLFIYILSRQWLSHARASSVLFLRSASLQRGPREHRNKMWSIVCSSWTQLQVRSWIIFHVFIVQVLFWAAHTTRCPVPGTPVLSC